MGPLKKCQPIRFSRLAGKREHICEFLVLLYREDNNNNNNNKIKTISKKIIFHKLKSVDHGD